MCPFPDLRPHSSRPDLRTVPAFRPGYTTLTVVRVTLGRCRGVSVGVWEQDGLRLTRLGGTSLHPRGRWRTVERGVESFSPLVIRDPRFYSPIKILRSQWVGSCATARPVPRGLRVRPEGSVHVPDPPQGAREPAPTPSRPTDSVDTPAPPPVSGQITKVFIKGRTLVTSKTFYFCTTGFVESQVLPSPTSRSLQ